MPVPRHWHPVFCAISSKKKRFRVYQLSWISVSATLMTRRRATWMTKSRSVR
ncbi:hypothetical protein JSQ73_003535 [Wolbachia endosymbiont of Anopheles demeilloni]|nr:hypothetical protein JSQ73_003535 [Wolbachia endosymbiont of Anopheles demeilloni]